MFINTYIMKQQTNLIFGLIIVLISNIAISQTVDIEGYAYLEGQSNHDSIKLLFERTVPSTLSDSVYTDNSGYFNITIETGIYNITYSKQNFILIFIFDQILYSNTLLADTTLECGLCGQLSGILPTGIYKVGCNIEVPVNDTLTIEPGVTLLFKQDIEFDINGLLIAEGTSNDSIIFTQYNDTTRWNGLKFNNDADDNSILSFCLVEYSKNSGIYCNNSSINILNSTISNNDLVYYGGGIYFENSNSTIQNSIISNNNADSEGGGIYFYYSNPTIINTIISHNYADYGGGIYCDNSNSSLKNNIINNNSAGYGGGIYCLYSDINITNSNICSNSAVPINHGGGISCEYSSPTIVNSIISDNSNMGIAVSSGNPTILNSDFWNNTNGDCVNCDPWIGVNVTVNANGDSIDPYGNLQLDPIYTGLVYEDYHLQTNSPCIDAGINDQINIQIDFDNNIRIWDGNNDSDTVVDMGAYEFGAPLYTNLNNFTDQANRIHLNLYPNPSNGIINIETFSIDNYYIEIYDIRGQLIYENQIIEPNYSTINLSNQKEGIYILRLHSRNAIRTEKIIIM